MRDKCPNCLQSKFDYYSVEDLIKEGAKPNILRGLYPVYRCRTCEMNFELDGSIRNIYEDYDWRERDKDGNVRTEPETFEERWGSH